MRKNAWPDMTPAERDALVLKLMPWDVHTTDGMLFAYKEPANEKGYRVGTFIGDWSPSTNIADAMELVDSFAEYSIDCVVKDAERVYFVECASILKTGGKMEGGVISKSLPEAICIASLRAKGVEV